MDAKIIPFPMSREAQLSALVGDLFEQVKRERQEERRRDNDWQTACMADDLYDLVRDVEIETGRILKDVRRLARMNSEDKKTRDGAKDIAKRIDNLRRQLRSGALAAEQLATSRPSDSGQ